MPSALVLAATGFETMELLTPVDYLRRAGVEVTIAAVGTTTLEVASHDGLVIKANVLAKDVVNKSYDLVVVPGGLPGTPNLAKDAVACEIVKKQAAANKYLGGICAAPGFVFAAACGIMKGRKGTGYPGCTEPISKNGGTEVDQDVVVDGKLITGRGPAFAQQFAVALVENLCGKAKAQEVNNGTLYK